MPPAVLILIRILLGIVKIIQAAHPGLTINDAIPTVIGDIEALAHIPVPGTTTTTPTP